MRPWLRWSLFATLLTSIVMLWSDRQLPAIVAASVGPLAASSKALAGDASILPDKTEKPPLPSKLDSQLVGRVQRDVFADVVPATPRRQLRAVAPVPVVVTPLPAGAPIAPPVTARFLGRMVTPDGERLVFISHGDKALLVRSGDRLDDGYVVETVTDQRVILVYPDFGVKVELSLPPSPEL